VVTHHVVTLNADQLRSGRHEFKYQLTSGHLGASYLLTGGFTILRSPTGSLNEDTQIESKKLGFVWGK
jgi:hypothetical protein